MHVFVLVVIAAALSPSDAHLPPGEAPQTAEVNDPASKPRREISLQDLATLTSNGVADEIIIAEIHKKRAANHLSGDEIVWLKQNGVHDCVIEALQATAAALPPPVVIHIHGRW